MCLRVKRLGRYRLGVWLCWWRPWVTLQGEAFWNCHLGLYMANSSHNRLVVNGC